VNGNDRDLWSNLLSKEIARVQYDDDDNCKETSDYFVLPSRTIMNYQARLSYDRLVRCLSFGRFFFFFSMYVWYKALR
jgi:hypothetical protein